MSTGQTLNNLEAILDRILDRISHASIALQVRGGIPKPTDKSYHDFWDKISGFQTRLAGIVRQLSTLESNLDFRPRIARRLPRAEGRENREERTGKRVQGRENREERTGKSRLGEAFR